MRNSPMKPRTKPMKKGAWIKRGKKPLPWVNKARAKRRLASYKAFMASPEWKAIRTGALERAGRQCEELVPSKVPGAVSMTRCGMRTTLTVHHKSYARFGGQEQPRDLQVLCKAHHDAVEGLKGVKPLWKRAS